MTLEELIEFNPKVKFEKQEYYDFIPMENINPNEKFVSSVEKSLWDSNSGSKFENGDVLFARIYPCLDNKKIAVARVDGQGFGSTEFFVLRAREGISDPNFIFYLAKTDLVVQNAINSYVGASGRQRADLNFIKRCVVDVPSFENQQKIAGILSAYDELIENNKKRIALLETMAEELYKEWFVRFRFPNYENTEFEKGVPSNWEETTLKYIANVTMGQSPSSEFYNDAGVGLPFHQGVGTYGERFPINTTFCSVEGRLAQENDILFSVRAPVGRLNIATTQSIIGRGLCAINSKNGQSDYLFYLLNHTFSKEDIIGNGAIFNSVSKDELLGFKLLKPNDEIVEAFNNQAKTINEAIRNLYDKNENLTEQKNKLLPKLISGKLSVKHLNIQQPPTPAQPTDNE